MGAVLSTIVCFFVGRDLLVCGANSPIVSLSASSTYGSGESDVRYSCFDTVRNGFESMGKLSFHSCGIISSYVGYDVCINTSVYATHRYTILTILFDFL